MCLMDGQGVLSMVSTVLGQSALMSNGDSPRGSMGRLISNVVILCDLLRLPRLSAHLISLK